MGLLEDAIREHLELKRSSGAEPDDVARLEREALSPATREAAPADSAAPVAPVQAEVPSADIEETLAASPFDDSGTAVAPDPDAPFDFEFDPSPQVVEDAAVAAAEPEVVAAEPKFEAAAPEPVTSEPEPAAHGIEVEPAEPEAAPPPTQEHPAPAPAADLPSASQETVAFDAEEIVEAEDVPDADADAEPADPPTQGEDVLEDTPEFLAETPDHDRLWFEQKPPKDFDF